MNNEDLRRVQLSQLDILKEVARVCEENEIEYFLDSGTALGAVRHGGFIPWDDDIDIGMTRDNYDKFLKIASEKLKEEYFLQTNETDKQSPYIYAKVRKNNTVFMEWNKRNINMHHGIYIDIFPYDNVPDDDNKRQKYMKRCRNTYLFYVIRSIPDRSAKPENNLKWVITATVRRMLHWISHIIPLSTITKITNNMFTKYNQEETRYLTCHVFSKPYIFERSDLFPLKKIKFEDDYFSVVNDVDKYLTNLYGDYKQLPPEDKRVGHRPYKLEC